MRLWRLGEMDLVSNCILFHHHSIVRCFYKIMQELRCMLYGYGDDRQESLHRDSRLPGGRCHSVHY